MAKAGRKPNPSTELVPDQADPEALARGGKALTAFSQRSAEIASKFGDGLPYHRDRVVSEARFFMGESAQAMLEAGKRLIQLKENEPHGDFTEILENQLGLERRTAQRMMAAAVKYLSPQLEAKATTLSLLGKSKLFDLMVESDDDLEALADGGTLAGHTLDEIETMSARELKAALRQAHEDLEGKQRVIDARTKAHDKLVAAKKFKPDPDGIAKNEQQLAELNELAEATLGAEVALMRLAVCVETIEINDNSSAMRGRSTQAVQYMVDRLAELIDQHQIDVEIGAHIGNRPEWLSALPKA